MNTTDIIAQKVAIQGSHASYHELAAKQFFGPEVEVDMCSSFPQLFASMEKERSTYAVMAIENSLAGTILTNYALLRDSGLVIIGEVYLHIDHQLMALPGQSLEDIKEIHSHPMALAQCGKFLLSHPHITVVEKMDTAGSAEIIAQGGIKGVAAIASAQAAARYNMEILASHIEDNKRNFTRFLVLCMPEEALKHEITPEKASICFNLKHETGSLANILLGLSYLQLNLTKIQSSPIAGKEWEYFFHIDLEFDDYSRFQRAMIAINSQVEQFQCLGEYAKGKKPV